MIRLRESYGNVKPDAMIGIWRILGWQFRLRGPNGRSWHWAAVCRCSVCDSVKIRQVWDIEQRRTSRCCCNDTNRFGKRYSPLYAVWRRMVFRCHNQKASDFKDYGGRGVSVCDEWRTNADAFVAWAIENGWKQGLEIDRRNNNGGYFPGNCRFVTGKVNCRNRRDNRILECFGETKTMVEWPEDNRCQVGYGTLAKRLRMGWTVERSITEPRHRR